MRTNRFAAPAVAAVALAALVIAAPGAAAARARFDTQVLAVVPPPGFPAMAYVSPQHTIYEGTYDNPSGSTVPSRVLEYSSGGALERSWTMQGQNVSSGAQGVQVATSDAQGRLILLDKTPPRVVVLDPRDGSQTTIASFPAAATPNYAAWGPDGQLYVTDYTEPIIWRVNPGGGTPAQWFTDPQLNGGMFGATAILLTADRRHFLVGMQSESSGGAGNPSSGRIFTLPVSADGKPGTLAPLWESGPADGPDGFAIAQSGDIYVPLLVSNELAEVAPNGHELARFPTTAGTGANGSSVPFDSPSSVRFLGTDVVVANQSYVQGNAAHQAILDVETGEAGLPEFIPGVTAPVVTPTAAPAKPPVHHKKKKKAARHRHAKRHTGRRHRRS